MPNLKRRTQRRGLRDKPIEPPKSSLEKEMEVRLERVFVNTRKLTPLDLWLLRQAVLVANFRRRASQNDGSTAMNAAYRKIQAHQRKIPKKKTGARFIPAFSQEELVAFNNTIRRKGEATWQRIEELLAKK